MIERIATFVLEHRTTTRVVAVIIPFTVVWTFVAVVFRWAPGLLDGMKTMASTSLELLWFVAVIPGAVFSL